MRAGSLGGGAGEILAALSSGQPGGLEACNVAGGVGRSRQRNGNSRNNNNERAAAMPSITCNNDRENTTGTKQTLGFYSKIFHQYLPSSFNLNHTPASGSNGKRTGWGTKSLQQKLDDAATDDDDDDDDEKVNFAKRSKNNADEADCRLRRRAALACSELGGKKGGGAQHEPRAGEGALERRELCWPASEEREPEAQVMGSSSGNNDDGHSRPDAIGERAKQRKVFESDKRNNNQRRKIESSSSSAYFSSPSSRPYLNNRLKSIANAFGNKLRAPPPNGSGDLLKLSAPLATATKNDPQDDRRDRAQNQLSPLLVETSQKCLVGKAGEQKYDNASVEELKRQRQLELVLETRRNELREQLNRYKEQVRADPSSSGNGNIKGGFKRKGFLHLKRNSATAFVLNANLIRLENCKGNKEAHLESTSALIGLVDQNEYEDHDDKDKDEDEDEDHTNRVDRTREQSKQQQVEEKKRDQNNNNNEANVRLLLIDLDLSEGEEIACEQDSSRMPETTKKLAPFSSAPPSSIRQRPVASGGNQRQQNDARGMPGRQEKGPASPLMLMLTLAVLCLVGVVSIGPHLALAQHQPPPSFTRSQPSLLQASGQHGLPPQAPSRSGPSLSPAQLPPSQQQQQQQQHLPPPPPPSQSLQQQQQQQPQQQPNPLPATGSLVANINCNKIRGHVTLTPNLQGGTTITTQITTGPPGEVYQWSIHQFPIKPGAAMCSCSALILGSKLVDLSEMHGNLPSDQEFSVQSSLALFGFDSPVGHSLLLRGLKTGMVACGTFLPTSRKSNYRAKFHTPLSGSVTVFQTAFGTSFLSHLMYSNGTRRHSMHRFDILRSEDDIITTSLLGGASPTSSNLPPSTNLNQIEQREHENELQACRRFSSGEPLFKNLTYQLSVSTENFGMRGRTALVLPQIPFETFSSVYVVVYSEHDPMEPIACAPLRFVKPKTAAAKFQTVSVQGQIVFSQDSPYDVTVARVNLNFPNSDGHSYGIDELPMIIRRKSDTRVCPNIREIIYNPHHIEPSSVPPEGEATSDQYAVGDLSGKYGSLTGKQSEKITVNDHNLPLFGPVSIIGRALTIYSAEGVAIACSNVELTSPMTTAFATFDFGIQGQFIFRQQMNDCNGDTYVYIEVSKPSQVNGQQQSAVASLAGGNQHDNHLRSLDHNWHIHANPVDSGLEHLSTTECAGAGGHYNPYNTSTSTIYSRDCTPFNVLRCELGDLSSKMFTIEIPPYKVKSGGQEPDIGKFFGTDIDLPLCGPVSIVNRSVVVHVADFGSQRLACSTVIEFKPRTS